jgi:hypothetical protein
VNATKTFFDTAPSLFIQTGDDKSQLFGINFARKVKHRFVLRISGGCGLMDSCHSDGMNKMAWALSGLTDDGKTEVHKPFQGFCLSGGTRMVSKADPTIVVTGVTEVPPAMRPYCPDAIMLGLLAKTSHMKYSSHGIVVHDEPGHDYATIVHPNQHSVVLLQPSADVPASWDDEVKEAVRICDALREIEFKGLLFGYNGGMYFEKELKRWAALGKHDPFWQVLLVKGSGRKSDMYAEDEDFLAEHPHIHVCDMTVDSMRQKLTELGALEA